MSGIGPVGGSGNSYVSFSPGLQGDPSKNEDRNGHFDPKRVNPVGKVQGVTPDSPEFEHDKLFSGLKLSSAQTYQLTEALARKEAEGRSTVVVAPYLSDAMFDPAVVPQPKGMFARVLAAVKNYFAGEQELTQKALDRLNTAGFYPDLQSTDPQHIALLTRFAKLDESTQAKVVDVVINKVAKLSGVRRAEYQLAAE